MSILFHHSNSRLPSSVEKRLSWFLVTPRMHAIHHSIDPRQTDSNYSSGLAIWDRLHRTFVVDAEAEAVVTGVEGFQDPARVRLIPILELPWQPAALTAGPQDAPAPR